MNAAKVLFGLLLVSIISNIVLGIMYSKSKKDVEEKDTEEEEDTEEEDTEEEDTEEDTEEEEDKKDTFIVAAAMDTFHQPHCSQL